MTEFLKWFKKFKRYGLEHFGRYYGEYDGIVVDNADPDNRFRLRVKCPAVFDEETDKWVLSKGIYAGKGIGMYFTPQKGDPVTITFKNGDPRHPRWTYGWFPVDYAPEGASHQVNIIRTPSGNQIIMDDANNKIVIKRGDGKVIEIQDGKINLGTEGDSAEPGVLGDKNASLHDDHLGQLSGALQDLITFATTQASASSASTPTIGLAPGFTTLATAMGIIKLQVEALKATAPNGTKSTIVKLD